jgi:hypothetical protein
MLGTSPEGRCVSESAFTSAALSGFSMEFLD